LEASNSLSVEESQVLDRAIEQSIITENEILRLAY